MSGRRSSQHPVPFPTIPQTKELFVIGDVHGCADELEELLELIPLHEGIPLVFIGDFIDRGPASRQVIERVLELRGRHGVYPLMGNHESSLLEFVERPASAQAARFLLNGGGATLQSYSQRPGCFDVPAEHLDFIRGLPLGYHWQDYFFVHAGLPEVAIEDLDLATHRSDMLWIRRRFLESSFRWSKTIVHGHTPRGEVELLPNRINVDTGCVFDNALSALSLPAREVYSVSRRRGAEHVYFKDAPESKRRAVRFEGAVNVTVERGDETIAFETINYNDFGALLRHRPQLSWTSLFSVGDEVEGEIVTDGQHRFRFRGKVVRVDQREGERHYAIQFHLPPTESPGQA